MEIIRRLFRKPPKVKSEIPSRMEGYLEVGMGGQGTNKRGEKVIIPSETPIWVTSGHPIDGEISGATIGLIETIEEPITLTIKDPVTYLATRGKPDLRSDDKFLSDVENAIKEEEKFLSNEEELEGEEAEVWLNRAAQDAEGRGLDLVKQSAVEQLTIRSLNEDINLTIQDPNLEVVISDESNYRDRESVMVKGKPPLNPARKVSVSTFRGNISINYPDIAA